MKPAKLVTPYYNIVLSHSYLITNAVTNRQGKPMLSRKSIFDGKSVIRVLRITKEAEEQTRRKENHVRLVSKVNNNMKVSMI